MATMLQDQPGITSLDEGGSAVLVARDVLGGSPMIPMPLVKQLIEAEVRGISEVVDAIGENLAASVAHQIQNHCRDCFRYCDLLEFTTA